jgi:hypothetical protein
MFGEISRATKAAPVPITVRVNRTAVAMRLRGVVTTRMVIVVSPAGIIIIAAAIRIVSPAAVFRAHEAETDGIIRRRRAVGAIAPVIAIVGARTQEQNPNTCDQRKNCFHSKK